MSDVTRGGSVVVVTDADASVYEALKGGGAAASEPAPEDEVVRTEHHVRVNGLAISYEATAGTLTLKRDAGERRARVFYVAYRRTDVEDGAARPVTFAFNGGPGSSSVWLHLGAFGPRKVPFSGDRLPPPPYRVEDNPHSLLDLSDLVFIDPVSTGFSRAEPGSEEAEFHGVKGDIESIGEFIRLWLTRFDRWGSPKYIAGESYGTTRAAGLVAHLQARHGVFVNGIVLLSVALQFSTLSFDEGNELPYVLYLPGYAATAWYHGRLEHPGPLPALLEEVGHFAIHEYAPALLLGDRLEDPEPLVEKLVRYTGLSAERIRRSRLRVPLTHFCKELLREQGLTVGRLDSRFKAVEGDPGAAGMSLDPSYSAVLGPYTAAMNQYLRAELRYEDDRVYEILNLQVNERWAFDQRKSGYTDMAAELRQAMQENPHLRVLVVNGLFDLATPAFAAEYTVSHLGLDPALRSNVVMTYHEAGHMMYIHPPCLAQLKDELRAFLEG
ncbi:MAG: peptidase S10 [Alphaproteobacteria bacterium]|nr:peptidase S10 [Alphaproteobacteria bacterium]